MRMKYEITAAAVDAEGESTYLDLTVAHQTGDNTVDIKIGRGTTVMVDIDELAGVLAKVDEERRG